MQFRELETDTHRVDVSGSERRKNEKVVWSITEGWKKNSTFRGLFHTLALNCSYFQKKKNWTQKASHTCLSKTLRRECHFKQQRVEIIGKHPQHGIKADKVFKIFPWEILEMSESFFCLNEWFSNDYSNPKWIPTKVIDCKRKRKMLPFNWLNENITAVLTLRAIQNVILTPYYFMLIVNLVNL